MEIITAAIVGLITALVTIYFSRKKDRAEIGKVVAETEKTELDTVEQATRIWRELSNGLRDELKELRKEYINVGVKYNTLNHQYEKLQGEHNALQKSFNLLKKENTELKEKLNSLINAGNTSI